MNRIVAQSLFHTAEVKRSWQSQTTSIAVHAIVIGLAFLITIPVVRQNRKAEHVTLIAPQIQKFTPKIQPIRHIERPHLVTPLPVIPPIIKVPEVRPVIAEKPQTPPPPVLKPVAPELPAVVAELPKPTKTVEAAKAPPVPKIELGGFGDPNAVKKSETARPAPVVMAKLGSFESPDATGQSGANGRNAGVVKSTAFGIPDGNTGAAGKQAGTIRTAGFGESSNGALNSHGSGAVKSTGFNDTVAAAPRPKLPQATTSAFTPVEILYKPKPAYSSEARSMRVEGQVSLEVVFQASGAVKVVRVIRGLGHGLDEAAQQAALQVRFKPATRAGVAVDQSATISITFELS